MRFVNVCLKVWNYKQRRCLFTLLGHLDYIRTTTFHHVSSVLNNNNNFCVIVSVINALLPVAEANNVCTRQHL